MNRKPLNALWMAALRRPVTVLILVLVPAVALGWQARHLVFDPGINLLPVQDSIARGEMIRQETFGDDFRLLVAMVKPYKDGGAISAMTRRALLDLHTKLEDLPGISRVSSLVNAPVLVASPGAPVGSPVWGGVGQEGGDALMAKLSPSELEKFMFLSALWEVTPLYLETPSHDQESELVRRVQKLIAEGEVAHPQAGKFLLVGAGLVETTLASHIFNDLKKLIPFSILVVAFGLYLATRQLSLLVIAIIHCVVLLVMVLGGMAACGISVNLVSVLAPVILIPVGVADLLHLYVRLRSGIDESGPSNQVVPVLHHAYSGLEAAMLGTTATTALGFLAFVFSPVAAIRQFGLTMAAGAIVALLLTLTLDAALLALLWHPNHAAGTSRRRQRLSRLERSLVGLVASEGALRQHRRRGILICAVLAAAALLSLAWLRIDDTWIQNFDPGSRVVSDTRLFEQLFLGTNVLSVVVEADPAGVHSRQAAIELVNDVSDAFFFKSGVHGVLSAVSLARSLDPAQGKPWTSWPSPAPDELETALETWERHGPSLPRVSTLVSPEMDKFQVFLFVRNQPYKDLVRFVESVRAWSMGRAADSGVSVWLGGNLLANIRMVQVAVLGQARSLGALLIVLVVLTTAYLRSLPATVILLSPMVLAILLTYLFLLTFGIPYGVAVSMFPTLVIGLSLDFGIHLRAAMVRNLRASRHRWARDLAVVIRGILLNGLLWTVGFAVLTLSSLPPNRHLGLLCSVVVILSTMATLAFLPVSWLAASARPNAPGVSLHGV